MTGFFILFGGIALITGTVALLDWIGRRQLRNQQLSASPDPHASRQ